jgi:hypothetical protein
MVMVPEIDATKELELWLAHSRALIDKSGVRVHLRTAESDQDRRMKAAVEIVRGDRMGVITMWANGMIDCDVLLLGQKDFRSMTSECFSAGELTSALDDYLRGFTDAV